MGEAGGDLKICIALPTAFGDMERSVVVRDIRDGIVTALDVHYASGGVRVEPEFLYASSIDTIRHVFTAMARDQRFVGILGGIFSADAAVVAKAAAGTGLPCLVPAATADDLAEIADNVVQLNTTFRTRGVLLADYVFSAHRNASVGVLAPLDDVSRALTEAFIDRAKDLALRVEAVSWYAPGTNDLRSAYKALAERMSPYDTSSLLLVPTASRDNITALLKGYRQAGLKAKLLGAGDWNDPELLLSLLREDMRMEFESDYAVNTGFSQYRDFRSSYLKRTGREPGRDAVFGYDAARFFLNVISLGSYHREDLLRRMRRIWLGLRSPIDLRHGRSNRGLNIMRFSNGRIMRIATIPDL
jgi:ABC-type branched-subunit amino acid transport system substrate-binding protein